jgi:hypothetical protein
VVWCGVVWCGVVCSTESADSSLAWTTERATEAPRSGPRNGRLMVRAVGYLIGHIVRLTLPIQVSRIVGPEAYYMGIVDFQQLYDISKKVTSIPCDVPIQSCSDMLTVRPSGSSR